MFHHPVLLIHCKNSGNLISSQAVSHNMDLLLISNLFTWMRGVILDRIRLLAGEICWRKAVATIEIGQPLLPCVDMCFQ